MSTMRQDALDDAVSGDHNSSSIHTFAAEKRRVVEARLAGRRALASRVEAAVVEHEDPALGTCC